MKYPKARIAGRIGSWEVTVTRIAGEPKWLAPKGEVMLRVLSCYGHRNRTTGYYDFLQKDEHLREVDRMVELLKSGRCVQAQGILREEESTLNVGYSGVFRVDPLSVKYMPGVGLSWTITERLANPG